MDPLTNVCSCRCSEPELRREFLCECRLRKITGVLCVMVGIAALGWVLYFWHLFRIYLASGS